VFDFRRGLRVFLFTTSSRKALVPTQPPIQWVPRAISLGLKQPWREADHSRPSSAEVKEGVKIYHHSPIRFHGLVLSLKKHRDNFNFTFIFPEGGKDTCILLGILMHLHIGKRHYTTDLTPLSSVRTWWERRMINGTVMDSTASVIHDHFKQIKHSKSN
jgi:hypothetical protein